MAATDRFLAEIIITPFNFAPLGYAECNGQILPISQNAALFALLGTTYGGNGISTFALPDLQGRTPIGEGQGPGLSYRQLGEQGGQSEIVLLPSEIPVHTHIIKEKTLSLPAGAANDTHNPVNNYPGTASGQQLYSATAGSGTVATVHASLQTTVAGGSQPLPKVQPSLGVRFLIALQGAFPPHP